MSKPVKNLIIDEYKKRFGDVQGGVVVEIRGMEATANNKLRNDLRAKGVRVTVIRNSLARRAFAGGPLEALEKVLKGPNAFVYGDRSVVDVARDIVELATASKELELKGAILDGELFEGRAGVERLSKMPTRAEAQARIITIALSPAKKVLGCVVSPGSKILGIVKEIESRLEKGETIAAR